MQKTLTKTVDKQPSAPIHFVLAALAGVVRSGGDIEPLLLRANIPPSLINEPQARVSSRQFSLLVQLVTELLQDEFLGLANRHTPLGTFELMAFSAIHCSNLHEAIVRANRFYSLMVGAPNFEIEIVDDKAYLKLVSFSFSHQSMRFLVEALFTAVHRFICWLIDKKVVIESASFNYPALSHQQEYPLL